MNRNTIPAWIGILLAGPIAAQPPPLADSTARPRPDTAGEVSPWSGHVFHSLGTPYPIPFRDYHGQAMAGAFAYTPSFWGMQGRLAAGGYWYHPFGPRTEEAFGGPRYPGFRTAPDERWLRVPFDLLSWSASAQAGWFRWRTHPDGLMMGEYLARWNAYPLRQIRSGRVWERLDSLSTLVSGARFGAESPGKSIRQEVLLFIDGEPGRLDLSYAWSGQAKVFRGVEAGVTAMLQNMPAPFSGAAIIRTPTPRASAFIDTSTSDPVDTVYFSKRATLFSARLALDLAELLTGRARSDQGGRLHAEVAVLGWKDYPYSYDDRDRRTHLVAGLHLPAFGWLDAFRLQVERTPRTSFEEDAWFRPSVILQPNGSWIPSERTLPTHYWYGQAYLSKTWWRRLQLQSMLFLELGGEGGEVRPGESAIYVSGRALLYELRMSWLY